MIKELDSNVNEDIFSVVNGLCSAVYYGESFDDGKYNKLISYVQATTAWLHEMIYHWQCKAESI